MTSTSPATKTDSTNDNDQTYNSSLRISQELQNFYAEHNVELASLVAGNADPFPHRFVRLNPRYGQNETLQMLKEELGGNDEPIPVTWIDTDWGFYALPASFALASSNCFKSGRVYGMDVSSGAGPAVLLSSTYNKNKSNHNEIDDNSSNEIRVLDLCCCPGLKLCALADFLRDKDATIVGVDVSESRMALCKKIVTKYQVDAETSGMMKAPEGMKIQLYCQDGTSFGMKSDATNLVFDSRSAFEEVSVRGKRKRMNKSARARERKRLKLLAPADWVPVDESSDKTQDKSPSIKLFDYVLVDAECSTDGSLKHMKERLKDTDSKREETNTMLTDQAQLADLVDLQKRLIESGYRLLKPGGTLVYSTCSLSHDQNENVVKWLLDKMPDAFSIPVHFPKAKSKLVGEGSLQGTVRFYPNLGQQSTDFFGDGFFLAKLGKRR
jgi:16S rRNA C967 or C1407 C5-methylase (RsmB/RsmF family)